MVGKAHWDRLVGVVEQQDLRTSSRTTWGPVWLEKYTSRCNFLCQPAGDGWRHSTGRRGTAGP